VVLIDIPNRRKNIPCVVVIPGSLSTSMACWSSCPMAPNQSLAVPACVDDDAEDAIRSGDLHAVREAGLRAIPAPAGLDVDDSVGRVDGIDEAAKGRGRGPR
jgi:hypothetical protein